MADTHLLDTYSGSVKLGVNFHDILYMCGWVYEIYNLKTKKDNSAEHPKVQIVPIHSALVGAGGDKILHLIINGN